jgi:high-affinity nickel-transport protein
LPTAAILPLGALIAANLAAWLWAAAAFADRPALLGSALLAWLFGLRHAVDADHLAAIDNVVRKLMQDGQQPRLAGLFFSLGHASVVILAAALIAATASNAAIDSFQPVGGIIGTSVSSLFLLLIALANLRTLLGLLRRTHQHVHPTGGLLARLLRPALNLIRRPSHMFPLGFLFGLGFDTATEVGLLALAATQAAAGVSFLQVLIFPALFTVGMALVDTADSVLMVGAYGWAFADPARKRTYNIAVTAISVVLALGIAGIQAAGLLAEQTGWRGRAATLVETAADGIANLGFGIIALFVCAWAMAAVLYRRRVVATASARSAHPPP